MERVHQRSPWNIHHRSITTPTALISWQLWWMTNHTTPKITRSTCHCDVTLKTVIIRWSTKVSNKQTQHQSKRRFLICHIIVCLSDPTNHKVIPKVERADTPNDLAEEEDENILCSPAEHLQSIFLTDEERKQWNDVIRMNDYLTKGRRPQFWEEPFTKRVLDAIKNKNLEMKKAAKLLGVSYGTLYGRYRETYGCLKHPYR